MCKVEPRQHTASSIVKDASNKSFKYLSVEPYEVWIVFVNHLAAVFSTGSNRKPSNKSFLFNVFNKKWNTISSHTIAMKYKT